MSIPAISPLGGAGANLANGFIAGAFGHRGSATGVRFVSPVESLGRIAGPADQPEPGPAQRRERAARATAYQRNDDGDEAVLESLRDRLSSDERELITHLAARDAEVRAHEQAHLDAAGSLVAHGPAFRYTTGPDGRRYAVTGSVRLEAQPGPEPEQALQQARSIREAALAPERPSRQDLAIASVARRLEAEARRSLARVDLDQTAGSRQPIDSLALENPRLLESPAPISTGGPALNQTSPASEGSRAAGEPRHVDLLA